MIVDVGVEFRLDHYKMKWNGTESNYYIPINNNYTVVRVLI